MSFTTFGTVLSNTLFLSFVAGIPLYAACKRVKIYDEFIEGAKDGLQVTIKILPHLIGMLVGIGMFRAAGGFIWLGNVMSPLLSWLGIPRELLPLAVMRPFSGGASNGLLVEMINTHGADSLLAKMGATLMGSTETTFFVLAIYFGAISIKRTRYAVPTGLIADVVGVIAAVWVCRFVFT